MAKFSVAARTLVHLGAELITSDEVAVNELIKNSFDAESPRVKIEIVNPIPHQLVEEIGNKLGAIKNNVGLKSVVALATERLSAAFLDQPDGVVKEDAER